MGAMTSAKQWAVGGLVLAALAVPGVSEAGDTSSLAPSCVKYSDGSGYCLGSMKGFRNSPYTDAFVQFEMELASNWSYFFARYNNQFFSCTADATVASRFASAMASNGYFKVTWNAAGTCTALYVNNESSVY